MEISGFPILVRKGPEKRASVRPSVRSHDLAKPEYWLPWPENTNALPKSVLKLPELEDSKSAVLNSLPSVSSQRLYDHATRQFIDWWTVVTRYRIFLEQAHHASSTIKLRLAAVRPLVYEAADSGLLSPDLAAGIRRVKGAKKHGSRVGNWLTVKPAKALLSTFDRTSLRGKRDYAMVAILLGCGLRRAELAGSQV